MSDGQSSAKVTDLRCSNLDRLFGCSASTLSDDPALVRISSAGPEAELGKACHQMGAELATSGQYSVTAAAERYQLDDEAKEDSADLMHYALRAWEELKRFFQKPIAEAVVEGPVIDAGGRKFRITGTIDLCSPAGEDRAIFLDWKSGYIDDGYYHQMTGYAYLLWNHMGRPANVIIKGVVVFLRHRYYRVMQFESASLAQWEYDLQHNILSDPNRFTPGKQCRFCNLFSTCAARQAVVVSTITEMMGGGADSGWWERAKMLMPSLNEDNKSDPLVGQVVGDIIFRTRLLMQLVDNAKAMLRETIARVGPIPLGAGSKLALREVQVEQLDPVLASVVLRNHMSDNELAQCSKISLPKVLALYAAKSQKKKKEAYDTLMASLTGANAIKVNIQHRLEEVQFDETDEGDEDGKPDGESATQG